MAIGPIVVGDTGSPFAPQLIDDSGNSLVAGLTASAISMVMILADTYPPSVKTCSGSWVIDNSSTGACHYNLQAADVNQKGNWDCHIVLQQANGPQHLDPFQLVIKNPPGQQ